MARQIPLLLSRDQKLKAAGRVSRTLQKPWHRSSKPQRTARESSRGRVNAHSAIGTFRTCRVSKLSQLSGIKRKLDLDLAKGRFRRKAAAHARQIATKKLA